MALSHVDHTQKEKAKGLHHHSSSNSKWLRSAAAFLCTENKAIASTIRWNNLDSFHFIAFKKAPSFHSKPFSFSFLI